MSRAKVESYIALAEENLVVAGKLMRDHPRHCAFNIEQAAERLLKAVLTAEGIAFSSQHHQLGMLAELLPPEPVEDELARGREEGLRHHPEAIFGQDDAGEATRYQKVHPAPSALTLT